MKKALKITLSVIGIALLCLMILGQIAKTAMKPEMETVSQKSESARMIERADRDCPIPAAMGKGEVTGIKLENDYVTYIQHQASCNDSRKGRPWKGNHIGNTLCQGKWRV